MQPTDSWPYSISLAHSGDDDVLTKMRVAADRRAEQAREELATLNLIAAVYKIRAEFPATATIVFRITDYSRNEVSAAITQLLDDAGNVIGDQHTIVGYAWAAIDLGLPYVNFTPSLGASFLLFLLRTRRT